MGVLGYFWGGVGKSPSGSGAQLGAGEQSGADSGVFRKTSRERMWQVSVPGSQIPAAEDCVCGKHSCKYETGMDLV